MPLYEHVFLARQDVSQQQVEALTKEYSDAISEGGGKVTKTEYWGLKSLAFKIKKSRKAHFALMNIDAPPAAVSEMERRMSLSPDIIRFMTLRVEALESEPSVMMRKPDRDERSERGERGGFRGGFRGGDRGGFRGEKGRAEGGEGRSEGPREGPSTFRARPHRDAAPKEAREGGPRETGEGAPRAPRAPRPPRESKAGTGGTGSTSGSEG
jgi:small subunit ribosomal protein S6